MLIVKQQKTALPTVENKIPNINNLVKKTDYDKNDWNWKETYWP